MTDIGVLRVLDETRILMNCIAGTSMAAPGGRHLRQRHARGGIGMLCPGHRLV
jgi:hypothetical protein